MAEDDRLFLLVLQTKNNFQEKTALKTAIPKIVFYRIYSTATNELQILVGMAGFEPATFWSQTRRANQTALHPEGGERRSFEAKGWTFGSILCCSFGAPDRIRTRDPQIRSLLLYPAELLAHFRAAILTASQL
jgi:hypothetical protein